MGGLGTLYPGKDKNSNNGGIDMKKQIVVSGSYIILKNPEGKDFYIGAEHLDMIRKAISKSKSMRANGRHEVTTMTV